MNVRDVCGWDMEDVELLGKGGPKYHNLSETRAVRPKCFSLQLAPASVSFRRHPRFVLKEDGSRGIVREKRENSLNGRY